jgi:hydrogenase nickel incorporation protein HypA/HybF
MHEFSIAIALLDQVEHHAPADSVVKRVHLRIGPMQGIVEQAMQWAWQGATDGTRHEGSRLELDFAPWQLQCPDCGRRWHTNDMYEACVCGSSLAFPVECDEMTLVSLDVDVYDEQEVCDEADTSR